jgi:hypothetical protein
VPLGGGATLGFAADGKENGGTLPSTLGTAALFGHYIAGSFIVGADGHGGALVTEAQSEQPPLLTHPRA